MIARRPNRHAFSLVELIVVIVILGVLAALAIPRFSRAATESPEAHLRRDLEVLRIAIDMYFDRHGVYPGQRDAGGAYGPAGTEAAFVNQLTRFVAADGRVADRPDGEFRYGPYLRRGIPSCPVVAGAGAARVHVIGGDAAPGHVPEAAEKGWVYNCQTGYIAADSDRRDARGVRYDSY